MKKSSAGPAMADALRAFLCGMDETLPQVRRAFAEEIRQAEAALRACGEEVR